MVAGMAFLQRNIYESDACKMQSTIVWEAYFLKHEYYSLSQLHFPQKNKKKAFVFPPKNIIYALNFPMTAFVVFVKAAWVKKDLNTYIYVLAFFVTKKDIVVLI